MSSVPAISTIEKKAPRRKSLSFPRKVFIIMSLLSFFGKKKKMLLNDYLIIARYIDCDKKYVNMSASMINKNLISFVNSFLRCSWYSEPYVTYEEDTLGKKFIVITAAGRSVLNNYKKIYNKYDPMIKSYLLNKNKTTAYSLIFEKFDRMDRRSLKSYNSIIRRNLSDEVIIMNMYERLIAMICADLSFKKNISREFTQDRLNALMKFIGLHTSKNPTTLRALSRVNMHNFNPVKYKYTKYVNVLTSDKIFDMYKTYRLTNEGKYVLKVFLLFYTYYDEKYRLLSTAKFTTNNVKEK